MDPESEQRAVTFLEERLADRPAVTALSEEARARLLRDAGAKWRMRIGTQIAKRMSRRQTVAFQRAMDAGDHDLCRSYLNDVAPDSDDVVMVELNRILDEVERSASLLLTLEVARGRARVL